MQVIAGGPPSRAAALFLGSGLRARTCLLAALPPAAGAGAPAPVGHVVLAWEIEQATAELGRAEAWYRRVCRFVELHRCASASAMEPLRSDSSAERRGEARSDEGGTQEAGPDESRRKRQLMPGNESTWEVIGRAIMTVRLLDGVSQRALARRLGIARRQLAAYESNQERLPRATLRKILAALELGVPDFFAIVRRYRPLFESHGAARPRRAPQE
jgi:ribosome-binding protein aMBF1 (putative translation factor)